MGRWNSGHLDRALEVLRARDKVIRNALLAHVAPLSSQHVNSTGDFLHPADDEARCAGDVEVTTANVCEHGQSVSGLYRG